MSVVLADAAGNLSPAATSVFILDRTAPVPPTVVPPASPSNSTTPRWVITAPRGATLTCTLTARPHRHPRSRRLPDRRRRLARRAAGRHLHDAGTATDSAGNVSAASVTTYVLDTAPPAAPTLAYGSPSAGTGRSPFWGFSLPPGTSGRCELLQGGSVIASRSDCRGAVSFTINGPDGVYVVRIVAVDAAGNVSSPLVVSYQLVRPRRRRRRGRRHRRHRRQRRGRQAQAASLRRPSPSRRRCSASSTTSAAWPDQAAKTVRKAANGVSNALPSLPVIHDPLTNNVSHAVQNVVNAVSKAGGGTGFPLLLLIIVLDLPDGAEPDGSSRSKTCLGVRCCR